MLKTKLKSSLRVIEAVVKVTLCSIYNISVSYFPNSSSRHSCLAGKCWWNAAASDTAMQIILINAKTLFMLAVTWDLTCDLRNSFLFPACGCAELPSRFHKELLCRWQKHCRQTRQQHGNFHSVILSVAVQSKLNCTQGSILWYTHQTAE